MAVKPTEFYSHFRLRALGTAILAQIVVGLLMAVWYVNAQLLAVNADNFFVLFVAPFFLFELIATSITIIMVTEPVKLLSDAVLHATNQAGNTPPPNVTHIRYEKSGLSNLINAIYKLAGGQKPAPTPSHDKALDAVLNSMPVGIVMLDAKRRIVHANNKAPLHKNGTTLEALNLLFEQNNSFEAWLEKCERNEIASEHMWTRVTSPSGEGEGRRYFDILASYHKNGVEGIEVVITAIDRTTAYGPTEEAMDFIALAAHELRGPITVIRGYLEVLADELNDELSDDHKALMERLSVSANRLSGYINNILNSSRYDRRHLKLHLQEFKVQDIYAPLDEDLQMRARTNNRMLSTDFPADLPTVAADKNSIEEVIINLVDNGLKYSHEGGQVIVGAKVDGDFVEISVKDNGIGIPAPVIQGLFSKFYRSHRSRETVAGTGLGLYLSKAIVESHGGTVSVRSTEGHGSTFSFTLPIYSTVADKLLASNNKNESIIESSNGWIKNHAMYRG